MSAVSEHSIHLFIPFHSGCHYSLVPRHVYCQDTLRAGLQVIGPRWGSRVSDYIVPCTRKCHGCQHIRLHCHLSLYKEMLSCQHIRLHCHLSLYKEMPWQLAYQITLFLSLYKKCHGNQSIRLHCPQTTCLCTRKHHGNLDSSFPRPVLTACSMQKQRVHC